MVNTAWMRYIFFYYYYSSSSSFSSDLWRRNNGHFWLAALTFTANTINTRFFLKARWQTTDELFCSIIIIWIFNFLICRIISIFVLQLINVVTVDIAKTQSVHCFAALFIHTSADMIENKCLHKWIIFMDLFFFLIDFVLYVLHSWSMVLIATINNNQLSPHIQSILL